MKRFLYTLAAVTALAPGSLFAQRTGSFDTTVAFNGKPRAASMFVPASYNPANKYRLMVALHGLGDTCSDYRNALISSLRWDTNIPNTIFIMPEAETRNSDLYSSAGSEEIIRESMLFAMSQYHIDTANVVLQGFSLGGRGALRYGLDHPTTFKGLLLNTPAVQGVKEAVNGHPAAYSFDYSNAYRIPIYIVHGAADITYGSAIDSTYEQLVMNDAPVRLNRIAGMGHTLPAFARMQDFIEFFNTPGHAGLDLDLVKLSMPARSCQASVEPTLLIRNSGRDVITAGTVRITVNNGTPTTYSASGGGALPSFASLELPLPVQALTAGTNTITVEVMQLNGSVTDTVVANNKVTATIDYTPAGARLPLNEDFEGATFPPAGWMLQEAGDFYTAWSQDNVVAKSGKNSAGTFNTILIFDNAGRSEGLISPLLNLQSASRPQLSFDLAYNYHRYTPPYFTANVDFADTLDVQVSTDCGDHFTSIFHKGGADLATFAQPIINPLDINSCFIDPTAADWTRISLDLNSYATAQNAVLKFNYISALGGSINIDNVSIAGTTDVKSSAQASFRVYPNPATDQLTIDPGTEAVTQVVVLDAAGRSMLNVPHQAQNTQPFSIDLRALPAALYTVQLHTESGVRTTKVSVQR
jgi:pimeloyl-ACP methyl ester carboxylesterase